MAGYLERLNRHLTEAAQSLPADLRQRHAAYLAGKQNADGGFPGRDGESDLYYTGFALRGLALLDALGAEVAARAADYLRSCLNRQTSAVDFFSFLYACLVVQAAGGPDVLEHAPADRPGRAR